MGEHGQRCGLEIRRRIPGSSVIVLSIIGALAGCETGGDASGVYPSLRSVPEAARASTPVDERRDIVRGLIEERDWSRQQTAKVRTRSGLEVGRTATLTDDDVRAEDVIPDAPGEGDDGFRLTPGKGDSAGSVYRGESQFEDGSLDDFIRKLKRDTRPPAPEDDPESLSAPGEPETEDVDARSLHAVPSATIVLAALAPAVGQARVGERDVMIRLAAAEEEPGFFCGYLGWTVAWSSMCVDDTATQPAPEGDGGVGADLGGESGQTEDDGTSESRRSARSRSSGSDEAREERAERRLSEEDAAEAIENAGRSALAPVTSSLDKLRDFIEARRSRGAASSQEEGAPVRRRTDSASQAAAVDRPPVPRSRPKRREDITVADGGETFDFVRTPRPHFKPSRDDPVILPPAGERQVDNDGSGASVSSPPPRPRFKPTLAREVAALSPSDRRDQGQPTARPPPKPSPRPNALLAERGQPSSSTSSEGRERLDAAIVALADGVRDIETSGKAPERSDETSAAVVPQSLDEQTEPTSEALNALPPRAAEPIEAPSSLAAIEPAAPSPAETPEDDPVIITFEPETPGLPEGVGPRLAALLTHARSTEQTIHIIGEASTNHLARRRATDVGAALVQLGATVEILEYDHQARNGVDQVRLVLRPETFDPLFSTIEPAPIEK